MYVREVLTIMKSEVLVPRVSSVALALIIGTAFCFCQVIAEQSAFFYMYNHGVISLRARPLHTDGQSIKNDLNQTVYLRGVWKGGFASSCTGWWGKESFRIWNESAARESMRALKEQWGANVLNVFFWADWWIDNASTSLSGISTDQPYRYCIKESVKLAQEYGLYFQLRMYGASSAEGRVEGQPYAPFTNNGYIRSVDDYVSFWSDFASEFKNDPNVIFALFDEPTGNQTLWFETATRVINSIRARGIDNLIVVHWGYCGSCLWMEQWVQQGRPTYNILFSNHIYRYHGTFESNSDSATDIEYIRTQLGDNISPHRAYKYITDTYNIPIWVSAIGAYEGETDNSEYVYFRNTLDVLNEWNLSYVGYQWQLGPHFTWDLLKEDYSAYTQAPNRVGQALIDAIAGIPAPKTYVLGIQSDPSGIRFQFDGIERITPFGPATEFGGYHNVGMPSNVTIYSHSSLFGNTQMRNQEGYWPYMYTAGPFLVNQTLNFSAINLFAMIAGKAKVALYLESGGNPDHLIVASQEEDCAANAWHAFTVSSTTIPPGNYSLAIKLSTNLMITGVRSEWSGKYKMHDYALPFPDPFGAVDGGTGIAYAIYVPSAPVQVLNYSFDHWEDGSTYSDRTIDLATDITLTATYRQSVG